MKGMPLLHLRAFGLLAFIANQAFGASTATPPGADGWTMSAPREEIRPAFEHRNDGATAGGERLIIRAENREGLDGHWTKRFPVQGGHYYQFRAVRRIRNVPTPRRSTFA